MEACDSNNILVSTAHLPPLPRRHRLTLISLVAAQSNIHPGSNFPGQVNDQEVVRVGLRTVLHNNHLRSESISQVTNDWFSEWRSWQTNLDLDAIQSRLVLAPGRPNAGAQPLLEAVRCRALLVLFIFHYTQEVISPGPVRAALKNGDARSTTVRSGVRKHKNIGLTLF
jgi:hypothetical protein